MCISLGPETGDHRLFDCRPHYSVVIKGDPVEVNSDLNSMNLQTSSVYAPHKIIMDVYISF